MEDLVFSILVTNKGYRNVFKHLHRKTSIGQVLTIAIQIYQLLAGIAQSVLVDTHHNPWCNAPWLNHLWQFLHHIHGQILLENPWLPPCHHQHDCYIMDGILTLNLPPSQVIQLSSMWLYLQVTVLSKITNHSGTHVFPAMLYLAKPSHSTNAQCNHSLLQWPAQSFPRPAVWNCWCEIISWLYLECDSIDFSTRSVTGSLTSLKTSPGDGRYVCKPWLYSNTTTIHG